MAFSRRAPFLVMALGFAGAAIAAEAPPSGAASCSGCHPAAAGVDTPVVRLAGRPARDIEAAMREFRAGQREASIMDRVAKGFDEAETAAIAAWFAALKD